MEKTMSHAAKIHPEIAEAIEAAQLIGRELHALHTDYALGKIDKATFGKKLEALHRHNANELTAMIANLSYEVRS